MNALRYHSRRIAVVLLLIFVMQLGSTQLSYGLTSGPSQPEAQSFSPAGTTDMVDLFSGDFSYNIPLFELPGPNGGYPFNLSYQSGIGMDQEATWVGLGWSLNPGAINRQMRGLPDEFKGDPIYTKTSITPSVTVGVGAGLGLEFVGKDGLLSVSVGLGINLNNYKGVGYTIDGSVGFGPTQQSGLLNGIGLDLSLDSKEGVGVNPSLNLGGKLGDFGLSAGYNSKEGLQNITATVSNGSQRFFGGSIMHRILNKPKLAISYKSSATLSFAHPGYTPQISTPMQGLNISATFKIGTAWWGVYPDAYVKGFYNEQRVRDDKKRVRTAGYGYMNYQSATDASALLDFNREKDGMVTKEGPNLPIPSLTYDIYSVTGQGISAMYRPMRNDYGVVRDAEAISVSNGGAAGVDLGPPFHYGANLSVNHSKSVSGAWNDDNGIKNQTAFQDRVNNTAYEPWYFKVHGETVGDKAEMLNDIGGTDAVRIKLTGSNISPSATNILENRSFNKTAPSNSQLNRERKPRNQVIQTISNEQLLNGSTEYVSYFNVNYLDQSGVSQKFNRSSLPKHHVAGFTALTPEGLRYNYGIPAYNLLQEDVSFSVASSMGQVSRVNAGNSGNGDPSFEANGTEKYLKKTELPPFAHSYLLTSIIGADYVDVTGNGVTSDDLGYWVVFTYQKATTDNDRFKWRDPYSQAHFIEGWATDPRDDKGSFTYGEKEIWYLSKAETKSHIATFTIIPRDDARGVAAKLQDTNGRGKTMAALSEIKLYTRSAGSSFPIKTVRFEYDYSLCQGVDNNATGQGKLTLKKLWFEYGGSQRGRFNPYTFTYSSANPNYDIHAYDRWGNYKPYPAGDYAHNVDDPYVEQDPAQKAQYDADASAWSLTQIQLPSGGKIIVDYETDDYGYVQHQKAMQMMDLVDPYSSPSAAGSSTEYNLKDNDLKIRFRLEAPIDGDSVLNQRDMVMRYLDQKRKQLHFKIKVNLRSSSEDFHEYISGYADINFAQPMALEKDGSGDYAYGYFYVNAEQGRHPFSMRAWQHLRTNQPDLTNIGRKLAPTNSNSERIDQMKSLGSIVAQVRQMFEGFYKFCADKGWGREVVASGKSFVRLTTPDRIKYGGGLRVRQVTMKDQWSHDEEGIYGQIYEYTTMDGKEEISSGVASYEPIFGNEENALRYAKKFTQSIALRSDNNLFFEYPINESYYPSAQVGYAKVTVTSLAAASLAGKDVKNITLTDNNKLFPEGENVSFGTTGATVNEFYTARDFPVITSETEKDNKPFKLSVPIPFLGSVNISKLTASQGYSIVTNDMHGKPKKTSTYRQNKSGQIEPEPISWVKYNYATETKIYEQEKILSLTNTFKDNGDGTLSLPSSGDLTNPSVPKYALAQESEFFMDMRQFEDNSWGGGANANLDIFIIPLLFIIIPVPVVTAWPNVSKTQTQLRTATTNKIIFRAGVLESTEAFDGGSLIKTSNLKWDKLTGVPVLTKATNNFDAPVFNYSVSAYSQYLGMGAAYQNIGLSLDVNSVTAVPDKPGTYTFTTPVTSLYPGDELLLYSSAGLTSPLARAVYTDDEGSRKVLFSEQTLSVSSYKALIVRSGYRNQLSTNAGTVTALDDPTLPGTPQSYGKTIQVPK